MTRDYAQKRSSKKKDTQKKNNTKLPKLRIFFTLLGAISLIAAIVYLSNQPKDNEAPKPPSQELINTTQFGDNGNTDTSPSSDKKKTTDDKGEFEFYTILPDTVVQTPEVEAYKSTPRGDVKNSSERIQTGSFRTYKDAEAMRAKLILMNFPNVMVEKTTSEEHGVWYRVRMGPFANRSMLSKAIDRLVSENYSYLRIKK